MDKITSFIAKLGGAEEALKDTSQRDAGYKVFRYIHNNIPQLAAATTILAENIISPDEMLKQSIQVTKFTTADYGDRNNEIASKIYTERMRIKNIIETYRLEKRLFTLVSNTLINGDYFIELFDIDKGAMSLLTEDTKDSSLDVSLVKKGLEDQKKIIGSLFLTEEFSGNREVCIKEATALIEDEIFVLGLDDEENEELKVLKSVFEEEKQLTEEEKDSDLINKNKEAYEIKGDGRKKGFKNKPSLPNQKNKGAIDNKEKSNVDETTPPDSVIIS